MCPKKEFPRLLRFLRAHNFGRVTTGSVFAQIDRERAPRHLTRLVEWRGALQLLKGTKNEDDVTRPNFTTHLQQPISLHHFFLLWVGGSAS